MSTTEDEILELNKDQPKSVPNKEEDEIDLDNVLANQSEEAKKFDISKYPGMDTERLNAYYGTVVDTNNQIQIALSQLSSFIIPYNVSGDMIYANWTKMSLEYRSVTAGALNKRQRMMARAEDLNRQIQVVGLKIAAMQQELRDRQAKQFKAKDPNDIAVKRSSEFEKANLNTMRVEDLQRDIKTLEEIPNNINSEMQELKEEANWLGMQMYFHTKDKEVFDNVRADHLDNILKACDLKQMGLPKSPESLRNLPMQVRQGVS